MAHSSWLRGSIRRLGIPAAATIVAVIVSLIGGCSSGSGYVSEPNPTPAVAPPPAGTAAAKSSPLVGVWQGTTLAGCNALMNLPTRCNAEQKVTFTLIEGEKGLTGHYTCAYGNQNCFNMNTTGKVALVQVNGSRLTVLVMMPDGTSCRYSGFNKEGNVNGGYSCYQGASVFEQGSWRMQQSY